jgi:hypothetical protein
MAFTMNMSGTSTNQTPSSRSKPDTQQILPAKLWEFICMASIDPITVNFGCMNSRPEWSGFRLWYVGGRVHQMCKKLFSNSTPLTKCIRYHFIGETNAAYSCGGLNPVRGSHLVQEAAPIAGDIPPWNRELDGDG